MYDIENVYDEFRGLRDEKFKEGGSEATVAMFRVAVETGAESFGLPLTCYLMSKLLAVSLGIANEDENASYEDIFGEAAGLTSRSLDDLMDRCVNKYGAKTTKH